MKCVETFGDAFRRLKTRKNSDTAILKIFTLPCHPLGFPTFYFYELKCRRALLSVYSIIVRHSINYVSMARSLSVMVE